MIVTVTLNPCRDKTQVIEHFVHGGMNRVIESRQDLCGKGVNVSIALAGLGMTSVCLGFNFERDAAELSRTVQRYGIKDDFVLCPGGIRVNTKVLERDTDIMTEINEKGDFVSKDQYEALKSKVSEYGGQAELIAFSGSAPKGINEDCYAELIASARRDNPNVKVILDAEGMLLINGLKAKPDIIKPNLFELESIFNESVAGHKDIVLKCRELITRYEVKMICVSMGEKGAIITDAEHAYYAPPLPLTVRGLQGAGDSMVAGICLSVSGGLPLGETLRCAAAAASASIEREGTLLCAKEGFESLYPAVAVQKIMDSGF